MITKRMMNTPFLDGYIFNYDNSRKGDSFKHYGAFQLLKKYIRLPYKVIATFPYDYRFPVHSTRKGTHNPQTVVTGYYCLYKLVVVGEVRVQQTSHSKQVLYMTTVKYIVCLEYALKARKVDTISYYHLLQVLIQSVHVFVTGYCKPFL